MSKGMGLRLLALAGALSGALAGSGCSLTKAIVGPEKREVYEFNRDLKVTSPDFRRSAEALGNPMVGGNSAKILENGDEIFPAMIRDIRAAKQSVNLET